MTTSAQSEWRFYAGIVLRLLVLIVLIWCAIQLSERVKDAIGIEIMPHSEARMHRMIMSGLLVYIILTAIPFVPGAEIGMTLLTVFGAKIAPLVYLATVVSLMLAYIAGRLVPQDTTARLLRRMRLARVASLLERLSETEPQARPEMLMSLLENPALTRLAHHRYVALLVLINVPGNVVIGGGGGLALAAGLSGVFTPARFLLTVMIAVLPVPLALFLLGS